MFEEWFSIKMFFHLNLNSREYLIIRKMDYFYLNWTCYNSDVGARLQSDFPRARFPHQSPIFIGTYIKSFSWETRIAFAEISIPRLNINCGFIYSWQEKSILVGLESESRRSRSSVSMNYQLAFCPSIFIYFFCKFLRATAIVDPDITKLTELPRRLAALRMILRNPESAQFL